MIELAGDIRTDVLYLYDIDCVERAYLNAALGCMAEGEIRSIVGALRVPYMPARLAREQVEQLRADAACFDAMGRQDIGDANRLAALAIEAQITRHMLRDASQASH